MVCICNDEGKAEVAKLNEWAEALIGDHEEIAQNGVLLLLWPYLLWLIFKESVIDRILRRNSHARKSNL